MARSASVSKKAASAPAEAVPAAKAGPKPYGPAAKAYLLAYNLSSMAAWGYMLYLMADHFLVKGAHPRDLYAAIGTPLKVIQTTAILEVVHCATGLVRAPLFTTFVQVLSRVAVLWGLVHPTVSAQTWYLDTRSALPLPNWFGAVHPFTLMALAWSLVEVPRYLFYALESKLGLTKAGPPSWLTWLRYSLFLVLYPAGISGEVGCLLNAMTLIKKDPAFRMTLGPHNPHNIAFSYYFVCWCILGLYVPGSYIMYTHMLKARRSKLGGSAEKAKAE